MARIAQRREQWKKRDKEKQKRKKENFRKRVADAIANGEPPPKRMRKRKDVVYSERRMVIDLGFDDLMTHKANITFASLES